MTPAQVSQVSMQSIVSEKLNHNEPGCTRANKVSINLHQWSLSLCSYINDSFFKHNIFM